MFLVLGIITEITDLWPAAVPALLVALVLMLIARPLAITGCLLPFRYPAREIVFIGWMGMRGAVPIVLALFPLLAGIPQAQLLFHIAFFTVLLSLLLQGGTLPLAARWTKVVAGRSRSAIATAPIDGGESAREVVQFEVADGAPATRRAAQDIDWPAGSRMVEVLRGGNIVEPKALLGGDLVAVVAPTEQIGTLEELFGPAAAAGELTLDACATLGDLCDFYGAELPAGVATETTLADYAQRVLRGRAASGDRIVLGGLTLRVRESSAGRIRSLSLQLARTSL